MTMITDAELGHCRLDDQDLNLLECELRTGGTVNIRQLLKAVVELQERRESDRRRRNKDAYE